MKRLVVACLMLSTAASPAPPVRCVSTPGLAVDADGAPDSYRVDGNGLSYTCDGVFAIVRGVPQTQKNNKDGWQALCRQYWAAARASGDYSKVKIVGFLRDARGPVVQRDGDPLPGAAYVTTTSLTVPGTPADAQRHYVNAVEVPYVVLSGAFARANGLVAGDVVAVFRPRTGAHAFGVYGDCCSMGEASVRLHKDLGNDPIVVKPDGSRRAKRGIGDRVTFMPLANAHTSPSLDSAAWRDEIRRKGEAALAAVGGVDALRACSKRS